MILILHSVSELTADIITDWLHFFGAPFLRLNEDDLILRKGRFNIGNNDDIISTSKGSFKISDVKTVWFRKFGFYSEYEIEDSYKDGVQIDTIIHLSNEYSSFLRMFLEKLNYVKSINWLTNPLTIESNKIEQLLAANICGIEITETIITNSKEELKKFYIQNKNGVISKSIRDIRHLRSLDSGYHLLMYTCDIDEEKIELLPDIFFPSLFQNKVLKEIEIRSFLINDQLYSMAIFSQNDDQTSVDFRRYNKLKMNRMVPYKMPNEIEIKLKRLFSILKLDTGSADLIKTENGNFIFLEINPTGQFGFLSSHCNYGLEKIVAQHLIQLHEQ